MAIKSKVDAKYIYSFGGGKADGNESMKNLLGGKGANLAEMAGHKNLKLPVPPGFTVTTEVCTYYYDHQKTYPKNLEKDIKKALSEGEHLMGKKTVVPPENSEEEYARLVQLQVIELLFGDVGENGHYLADLTQAAVQYAHQDTCLAR